MFKFLTTRKITFAPITENQVFPKTVITSAAKSIPEWFKKIPQTFDGDPIKIGKDNLTNATVKACVPFLDALSIGYMYCLPMDVQICIDHKEQIADIRWGTGGENFVTLHSTSQFPVEGTHSGDIHQPFKWLFPFTITTPSGYSTLFTHPLNRTDLPFKTLSGVVDTDTYPLNVNFPFIVSPPANKTHIILEEGTPIAQIIPFKRESWQSEHIDDAMPDSAGYSLRKKIQNSYRKQWWKKKSYK